MCDLVRACVLHDDILYDDGLYDDVVTARVEHVVAAPVARDCDHVFFFAGLEAEAVIAVDAFARFHNETPNTFVA